MTRHRDHAGTGRRLGAELLVGVGAVHQQPWQVAERLDVVDDGGLTVEADGGREVRRLEAGHAPVALERLDERGLLADDVRAGAPRERDVDAELGAQDVLADVALGVGVVERLGDALLSQRHLAANVEEALGEAEGVAGDEAALDQLVRIALHEEAVLVGAGLGLVAVDHQVVRELAGRHEAPLDAGREAGAAAAEHGGVADLVVDGGRCAVERPAQTLVAAGRLIPLDGEAVFVLEA